MKKNSFFFTLGALGISLLSCQSPKPEKVIAKFTAEEMDLTVVPGDNFYKYANGGWMKRNPLPDDKSRFGAFDLLADENKDKIKYIVDKAVAENASEGSVSQKIGDFFAAGMDSLRIEKDGLTSLEPEFRKIDAISSTQELFVQIGNMHEMGLTPLFHIYSTPDFKNSEMVIAGIYQSGLGLPDRDYYISDGEREKEIRKAYSIFLTKIFSYHGCDEATAASKASDVLTLETRLAQASNSRLDNRDPQKTYHKYSLDSLSSSFKGVDWNSYWQTFSFSAPLEINVSQPAFLLEIGKMVQEIPLEQWKNYLKAIMLNQVSNFLSHNYVAANFELYGQMLSGQKTMEPRWKRVLDYTSSSLGEAMGQLYVQQYFPPEAKLRMEKLVENLRSAFGERIDDLDWMSDTTKLAAQEKLATIGVKVGYPNKWRDYSQLSISKSSYVLNILNSNKFEFTYEMAKVGKPVDKEEWHMYPQTVNAYYNPLANEIVFPAAILQPPFFYMDGDDAVNYGAIGVVIGHEMTHGFDDKGRQFDKQGNLNSWWTEYDISRFEAKTRLLVQQFNNMTVKDTIHADGELTLGENIADLGGLNIAYQAFQNTLSQDVTYPKIDNFNHDQRFILAYSRIWAQNIREKEMLRRVREDVHSLGEHRVNGPLPNLAFFYDAFSIDRSAPIFIEPDKRAKIW